MDVMIYTLIKIAVFLILFVFVGYVLLSFVGDAIKKYQAYQFKKSAEYEQKIRGMKEFITNKKYLNQAGFKYEFSLLPSQTQSLLGTVFTYNTYDQNSHTVYFTVSCPTGNSHTYSYIFSNVLKTYSFNTMCQNGNELTIYSGRLVISPSYAVYHIEGGQNGQTIIPALIFDLNIMEKAVQSDSFSINKDLSDGVPVRFSLGNYSLALWYDYNGMNSDVLELKLSVVYPDGYSISRVLYKLLTGEPNGFHSKFSDNVNTVITLNDNDEIIGTGIISGEPPGKVHISMTFFYVKKIVKS